MRVPYGWVSEYCNPGWGAAELADRLAMTGTEYERIDRVGVPDTSEFVVARVVSAEKHPDADRLSVCIVDDGSGSERQIVCGAPNVAAGQIVAVARPGAVMPDGTQLGEAKLRGVSSSGMILAEDEVGISDAHSEIMVLDNGAAPGAPLADHLPIADEVIDLEITPNRPDCLSVYGVAREVHAISGAELAADPTDADIEADGGDPGVAIEIDPEICRRFTARVFEDVKSGPSPLWLKARLTAAGQRPISNVVDITNYVMLLTGQPLHAFDLDEVRGNRIVVRRASEGERMTTLDDVERELDPSMALVCDAEGPSGIAGVMGGQISEVSGKTTRVLMEAATWVGTNILKTSKKLGLRSEASARFEKQLHPELALAAQRLAARLMVELCGARQVGDPIDVYPEPAEPRVVALRYERVERLLGERIPEEDSRQILERLGFAVDGDWNVTVPYWRDADVQREADVIEEIARVYGLWNLPTTMPARERATGRLTPRQKLRRRLEDSLRDQGVYEVVCWSFTAPATLEKVRLGTLPALRLANPLSEDQSVMRPLLLPGLLDAAGFNAARGRSDLALFESAHVYRPSVSLQDAAPAGSPEGAMPAMERHHIGVLLTGDGPSGWRTKGARPDFFTAKGIAAALLDAAGLSWWTEPGERPFLHPGRAASLVAGEDERKLGWVGEIHPLVAREWDLDHAVALELDFDLMAELAPPPVEYRDVSSFPPVIQDIAVVVDDEVALAEVEAAVADGGSDLLDAIELFDVYRGEQLGEGKKSLALRLTFRAPDRTLTDDEVTGVRALIEDRLAGLGGRLRA